MTDEIKNNTLVPVLRILRIIIYNHKILYKTSGVTQSRKDIKTPLVRAIRSDR